MGEQLTKLSLLQLAMPALVLALRACGQSGLGADDRGDDDDIENGPDVGVALTANQCVDGAAAKGDDVCNESACSKVVRILNYNVHALPETVSGDNPKDRMRRIGEALASRRQEGTQPDFVLLQEAFDKRDRISDRRLRTHR